MVAAWVSSSIGDGRLLATDVCGDGLWRRTSVATDVSRATTWSCYNHQVRSVIAWTLVMVAVGGCSFDSTGLTLPTDGSAAVSDGSLEFQLLSDFRTDGPVDGAPGSEDLPGDLRVDARSLDASLPDHPSPDHQSPDQSPDLQSPCVSGHFTTDIPGWAVNLHKGTWSWLQPTHAHQELPGSGYSVGELLIKGSNPMLGAQLQGSTTLTLKALYQNGYSHGAGLALLIKGNTSASVADRLVACVVKQSSSSGVAGIGIWYFGGSSNSASSLGKGSSTWAGLLHKPVKLTIKLVPAGGTSWTMTCAIDVAGKQDSVTKDISSYVSHTPYSVALVAFGTTVGFDSFSLCP